MLMFALHTCCTSIHSPSPPDCAGCSADQHPTQAPNILHCQHTCLLSPSPLTLPSPLCCAGLRRKRAKAGHHAICTPTHSPLTPAILAMLRRFAAQMSNPTFTGGLSFVSSENGQAFRCVSVLNDTAQVGGHSCKSSKLCSQICCKA